MRLKTDQDKMYMRGIMSQNDLETSIVGNYEIDRAH